MNGLRTIHSNNNSKPAPDNVVKLPAPEPDQEPDLGYDPDYVAITMVDEILSYADECGPAPPREPGEIDPMGLHDAFYEYFSTPIDPQVEAALKIYADNFCKNPLNYIPTTTPGYTKIVEYLRQFELRPR
jgi:hypothetical protein